MHIQYNYALDTRTFLYLYFYILYFFVVIRTLTSKFSSFNVIKPNKTENS